MRSTALASWTLLIGLAAGCGGLVASAGGPDASPAQATDASYEDSGGGPSRDAAEPDAPRELDASGRDLDASGRADAPDRDGGPDRDGATPLCPITMAYVDEAWPEIQSGTWTSCPDGGPCPAGDCCLQYTGWSPPTPMNTTACVPLLDGGM